MVNTEKQTQGKPMNPELESAGHGSDSDISNLKTAQDVVKHIKKGSDGKLTFPDGLSAELKEAGIAEYRRRDAQKALSQRDNELAKLKAENELLQSKISQNVSLSKQQIDELEDIKYDDPEGYYKKRIQFEAEARSNMRANLDTELKEKSSKILEEQIHNQKQSVLDEFNVITGAEMTLELLENELPKRILVQEKDLPLQEYYELAYNYLYNKQPVVGSPSTPKKSVNLGNFGGSGYGSNDNANSNNKRREF